MMSEGIFYLDIHRRYIGEWSAFCLRTSVVCVFLCDKCACAPPSRFRTSPYTGSMTAKLSKSRALKSRKLGI